MFKSFYPFRFVLHKSSFETYFIYKSTMFEIKYRSSSSRLVCEHNIESTELKTWSMAENIKQQNEM